MVRSTARRYRHLSPPNARLNQRWDGMRRAEATSLIQNIMLVKGYSE
jgi:hypothetical protein